MDNLNVQVASGGTEKIITPIKKSRLSDEVVVQLTNLILSGEFEPGSKLPTERELASMLSVTRTSLREALRRMETMGLIRALPSNGNYVEDYTVNCTLEFVKFLVSRGIGLDQDFIMSLEETRRILAVKMVELAVERIDDASVASLREIAGKFPRNVTPELLSGEWDFRFFRQIAVATGNKVFVCMMNSIKDLFGMLRWLYCRLDEKHLEGAAEFNGRLVDALSKRDRRQAVELIEQRMTRDGEILRDLLKNMK